MPHGTAEVETWKSAWRLPLGDYIYRHLNPRTPISVITSEDTRIYLHK